MTPPPGAPPQQSEFWEPYAQAARTVRAWFLAFGIGAPAIFVTNDKAAEALASTGNARLVVILFLLGVAFQVGLGLAYKHAMSYLYLCEGNSESKKKVWYKIFNWVTEAFWFEVGIDIITCTLFIIATVITLCALMP